MSQHSTRCFRKRSRHRLLVTAPSIHENNFVLTSVWGRGGEGMVVVVGGRPEIDGGQSRRLLFTYFPARPRCAHNQSEQQSRSRCCASSDTLRAQPQKCARTERKQPPTPTPTNQPHPPSTCLWSSIPFQRKVCGVVAQQSQGSSGPSAPSQVILGDEALGTQLRPPPPFKAFSRFLLLFSDVRRRFEQCLHSGRGKGGLVGGGGSDGWGFS